MATQPSTLKNSIAVAVDKLAPELEALSHRIHAHPELGYREVQAAGWLCDFLGAQGFKVDRGVGGVETAFRATIEAGGAGETGDGPSIAILCEYDALPGIGHACGHNVIATAGAGAGAGLAAIKAQLPAGRVHVIGTPAEEGGGGKIRLIKAGVFKDVDCAMMIPASTARWSTRTCSASSAPRSSSPARPRTPPPTRGRASTRSTRACRPTPR
jgi:amidohydrolase